MKWNSGNPPAIGWWPASNVRNCDAWRWWDGEEWSVASFPILPAKDAADLAELKHRGELPIEWRDWPKDMRHLPGYPKRKQR